MEVHPVRGGTVDTANSCEVVWIIDRDRLVDAESYERIYGSDGVQPLPSGYYVAQWPAGTTNRDFLGDGLSFAGPYVSRRAAEAALAAMRDGDGRGESSIVS